MLVEKRRGELVLNQQNDVETTTVGHSGDANKKGNFVRLPEMYDDFDIMPGCWGPDRGLLGPRCGRHPQMPPLVPDKGSILSQWGYYPSLS